MSNRHALHHPEQPCPRPVRPTTSFEPLPDFSWRQLAGGPLTRRMGSPSRQRYGRASSAPQ